MRKLKLNTDYFSKIDSDEKAYILGYIIGDGSVYYTDRTYYLSIASKDIDVLEYIKSCLESDATITPREGTNVSYIRFCSKELVSDLISLGLHRNKAKTIRFPKIHKKYHSAFICGLFDSDGSIHMPPDRKLQGRRRRIMFSGSEHVILTTQKILESYGFSKIKIKREKCGTFVLQYVTKHVELFWELMYSKSPYRMKRKEQKFLEDEIVQLRLPE